MIKVGYAFVVCDLLHVGHLKFLRKCKEYCEVLIVGVYSDELVESYKRKPIIPFEERIELVEALKPVDKVVKVENRDCTQMLKKLRKDGYDIKILFHGDDWQPEEVEGKEFIESIGGKLVQPPYYWARTTTGIIEKIRSEE